MKSELASFLSAKKEEFKETALTLTEETILLSSQPLQNEIERLKSYLVSVRELRIRNTFTPCVMVFEKQKNVASISSIFSSLLKPEGQAKPKEEIKRERR